MHNSNQIVRETPHNCQGKSRLGKNFAKLEEMYPKLETTIIYVLTQSAKSLFSANAQSV